METCADRPRTQRQEGRKIPKGIRNGDTKGFTGRYRHDRRKNDAVPAIRQTERPESQRKGKHKTGQEKAHADIRGRYTGG